MKKVLGFGDGLDVWRQDEYILKHRYFRLRCVLADFRARAEIQKVY